MRRSVGRDLSIGYVVKTLARSRSKGDGLVVQGVIYACERVRWAMGSADQGGSPLEEVENTLG